MIIACHAANTILIFDIFHETMRIYDVWDVIIDNCEHQIPILTTISAK